MGGILTPQQQQQFMGYLSQMQPQARGMGGGASSEPVPTLASVAAAAPKLPMSEFGREGVRRHKGVVQYDTSLPWGMDPRALQTIMGAQLHHSLQLPNLPTRIGAVPNYKDLEEKEKRGSGKTGGYTRS